jgi:hypothetical protein
MPKAFFTHETFALLIVHVPTNNSPAITFTANFTHQETRAFEQEHQTGNGRVFNVELATHSKRITPTRSITVIVSPLESNFNGSKSYHGSPGPMQRFSFSMFAQEELFMPFNETNKKVSSVIIGIAMNGTQIASSIEPIVIMFIVPKVKLITAAD